MRAKQGIPSGLRTLALAAALAAVCAPAGAVIVADGKLGANEYQLGFQMEMRYDDGSSDGEFLGYAKFYFGQNGSLGDQFFYLQLPTAFVDNTYGANANWSHTFSNLLNGDNQSISWAGGNTLTMDYLADCGTAGVSPCDAAGYRSGGAGNNAAGFGASGAAGGATWTNNDGAFAGAGKASVKEVATSLEYNLNNGFAGATTDSSTSASWIKEVGYEVQFAAGTFNPNDWIDKVKAPGLISIADPINVSPSRKTFKDYNNPTCIYGCTNVPEPGTNLLLGVGAVSLLWFARRRRDGLPSDMFARLVSR